MFTSVSSTAMGGCFIVGTLVMAVLTRRTRLFDLLVVFVGYACLTLSYVAIALSQFNIFAYYAGMYGSSWNYVYYACLYASN